MLPSQGRSLVPWYYSSKQEPLSRIVSGPHRPTARSSRAWTIDRGRHERGFVGDILIQRCFLKQIVLICLALCQNIGQADLIWPGVSSC
jgi:hypothetical protein